MLDKDNYPTEEALQEIVEWDVVKDVRGLLEYLEDIWTYPNYFKLNGSILELSTGGWSGNEEVIGALKENTIFWPLYWKMSRRGGHYEFEIKALSK